jgi:hypothetical protein
MAAPNIVNVTTITGKTAGQAVTTSATAIVTNSSGSNTVVKVNALYISNVDGTNNADITVELNRGVSSFKIAHTVVVPADAVLDVLSKSIYLEEGDSLRLTASANSDLEAVCSYEIIS